MFRSKEQTQFASRVEAQLNHGGAPLLLEGAAGLGKTRGFLAPLLACGKPVAVCVPTRALARQLIESSDLRSVRADRTVEVFTPRRAFATLAEYSAHKLACRNADLLVCTHQAALIDVLADGGLLGLKDRYAVLFDEADQLPDAAALRFDYAIDASTFDALGIKPGASHRGTVEAVLEALARKAGLLDEPTAVKAACRGMLDALDDPVWYQRVGLDDVAALWLWHDLPARALKRLLPHQRLAFVSASLTVNGSFDDFKRALGLRETSAWSGIIEPAQHGQLDIVSEDWDRQAPGHLAKVAEHVATLQGAVLVITTSHEDAALLSAMIGNATVRSDTETVGDAATRITDKVNVLVAAGAWAGLDTPMRWRHVVMPKAPYGKPTILDAHPVSRYVDSRNLAVRRFRQGLARGLRTPEAVCTLHLLDSRFARPEFVNALPTRFARPYEARYGTVELRTRQAQFRSRMLESYGGRCPISGCEEPTALEAAHLGGAGGWRTNHRRGILLRIDLHRMMDAGLIDIATGVVLVSDSVTDGQYRQFHGLQVQLKS